MKSFIAIPFKMESEHGMSTVEGLAKISPAGIVLEFEKKLFGILKDGIKEIRIPVSEILDVQLKSGIFNTRIERYLYNRIELRPNSLARLEGLPFKDGKASLKIKRADLSQAEEAIAIIKSAQQTPQLPPEADQSPLQKMLSHEDTETLELIDSTKHNGN